MNLDTGEIVQMDSPGLLAELEQAAKEEKLAKIEETMRDIGAERVLDEPSETYKELGNMPKASCRKCYGRGYIGKDLKRNQYIPCSCVKAK